MKTIKKTAGKSIAVFMVCFCLIAGDFSQQKVNAGNYYPGYSNECNHFRMPTQITKIGDTYYLVDSGHNQVLYSEEYGTMPKDWKVMASDLKQPHAIAGDGAVYLIVDTDNHRVVSFVKEKAGFSESQVFNHIGVRPHYIVYDEASGYFYVWSSMTGEMYLFKRKRDSQEVYLERVERIPQLYGKYVRSFTIEEDRIYFPCSDSSSIFAVNRKSFQTEAEYAVQNSIAGMVQLTRIGNYYYLTVSTDINYNQDYATFVRAKTLENFGTGNYENINRKFGGDGAPYYISYFDGSYFTVVLKKESWARVYKFDVIEDKICNVEEM